MIHSNRTTSTCRDTRRSEQNPLFRCILSVYYIGVRDRNETRLDNSDAMYWMFIAYRTNIIYDTRRVRM